ncbi:MAG: homocysteine S-methyltransferase family protein [Clostridia bacterium]|nr:homocysteine S-methyltransferase family protein [Clostridia bacterium]
MNFREFLQKNTVYLDGGMGTLLQEKGLPPGELPERWNLTHPECITEIHRAYFDAGSHVVCTNTFGANALKFSDEELERIIAAAVENARKAASESSSPKEKFIALDIGPCGRLLKPLGDMDFEAAVALFAKTVRIGASCGVDLVLIETMNDSYETKAALLAVKENSDLPVLVSNAYGENGKLMTGATPAAMVALLEGMGADALGANCSLGPRRLASVAEELLEKASVPVLLKPNAGLPKTVNGKTVFDVTPEEFSREMEALVRKGIRVAGGCCGTTPSYIRETVSRTESLAPVPVTEKNLTVVSSYTHAVEFGGAPVLIGERINPTGKKRFRQALTERDLDYILAEGLRQQEKGAHVLDVNVGLPEIDEPLLLSETVRELQTVLDLPLQIDTANAEAMEKALRCYNGKAMVNSVNGKKESMETVFPLVKKYGGLVVALTLDENGIPSTAEGRVEIARNILKTAESYGISRKDIIVDTLAMTVSADHTAAVATLASLRDVREKLGCQTSLGVSNVSFGLPCRDSINSTFFALALENGLSAAIMNPDSAEMMRTYHSFMALRGMDENCASYIEKIPALLPASSAPVPTVPASKEEGDRSELCYAIVKGLREKAASVTASMLESSSGLSIVENEIIPALNRVGKGFEEKTVYLPQLLMSAEAAKSAFDVIKTRTAKAEATAFSGKVVLATVRGDIHDIGKNIVKLLLENYGFSVVDLGKDVPPEDVVETAVSLHAPLVGLSALMTTTVPAMEKTVSLLHEKAPWCKIMVGGAVLTQEYASAIGADFYAKDAMEGVRYAESLLPKA